MNHFNENYASAVIPKQITNMEKNKEIYKNNIHKSIIPDRFGNYYTDDNYWK